MKKYNYLYETDPNDMEYVACEMKAGDILLYRDDLIQRDQLKDVHNQFYFSVIVSNPTYSHEYDDKFIGTPLFFHNLNTKNGLKKKWIESNVCSDKQFDNFGRY